MASIVYDDQCITIRVAGEDYRANVQSTRTWIRGVLRREFRLFQVLSSVRTAHDAAADAAEAAEEASEAAEEAVVASLRTRNQMLIAIACLSPVSPGGRVGQQSPVSLV